LAAAIRRKFGVDTQLIEGSKGIFDVKADGKLVYSKHETGRFPTDEEVLRSLSSIVQ